MTGCANDPVEGIEAAALAVSVDPRKRTPTNWVREVVL